MTLNSVFPTHHQYFNTPYSSKRCDRPHQLACFHNLKFLPLSKNLSRLRVKFSWSFCLFFKRLINQTFYFMHIVCAEWSVFEECYKIIFEHAEHLYVLYVFMLVISENYWMTPLQSLTTLTYNPLRAEECLLVMSASDWLRWSKGNYLLFTVHIIAMWPLHCPTMEPWFSSHTLKLMRSGWTLTLQINSDSYFPTAHNKKIHSTKLMVGVQQYLIIIQHCLEGWVVRVC
jgi:hypothetical protein